MRKIAIVLAALIIAAAAAALGVWGALYRVVPQPKVDRYLNGSIDPGEVEGIPYWIWLVAPRVFPEYVRKPGGYVALGLSWQEGNEMPVGFAKQRIGYIRVTGNCALCHATSRNAGPDAPHQIVPCVARPAMNLNALARFYREAAYDPRFTADDLLAEVDNATRLSLFERLLYKCWLIPRTRKELRHRDVRDLLFPPTLREHVYAPKGHVPATPRLPCASF
jgi:hypothetical protein